ncbi:MAG: hypothetical protein ABW075_08800 [Aeromicrobium sp.]
MPPTDLVADLAKKSGLVWVSYGGRTHAVWHEWVGDAVCIVSGGTEQALPGIADQQGVTLLLRSKTTRALAASVEARVEIVAPGSEHWDPTTTALKAGRLNLADSASAISRWADESLVVRLVPAGAPDVPATIDSSRTATRPHLANTSSSGRGLPDRATHLNPRTGRPS